MKKVIALVLFVGLSLSAFSQNKIDAKLSGFCSEQSNHFTTGFQNLELKSEARYTRELFFGFDLTKKLKPYTKVIFRVQVANASKDDVSVPLTLDAVLEPLSKEMTWATRPAEDKFTKVANVVVAVDDKNVEQTVEFDVTEYINKLMANKVKDLTLRISARDDKSRTMLKVRSHVYFDSNKDRSEILRQRPMLVFE